MKVKPCKVTDAELQDFVKQFNPSCEYDRMCYGACVALCEDKNDYLDDKLKNFQLGERSAAYIGKNCRNELGDREDKREALDIVLEWIQDKIDNEDDYYQEIADNLQGIIDDYQKEPSYKNIDWLELMLIRGEFQSEFTFYEVDDERYVTWAWQKL